jgi:hypothetical protein
VIIPNNESICLDWDFIVAKQQMTAPVIVTMAATINISVIKLI